MNIDERYMRMALKLAGRADGMTNPNPMVGAIIVKGGKITGRGYHKRRGLPHAESLAINDAGLSARGATLYVTLEPCDHFGMTPPCTDAIIESGIKRVVMAMKDPNPINNGRGISRLKSHKIKTTVGVLEKEAKNLNLPYIKYITQKIPYVTVKVAESIDGKIATKTGDSRWITSEDSRRYVHELRAKVDAVLVGVNTVLKDDPLLLSGTSKAKQPARIIVDSRLRTPPNAKIFSDIIHSPVIIATIRKSGCRRVKSYVVRGANILSLRSRNGMVDLRHLLETLGKMKMMHVLVEGGGELVWTFVKERLADRFLFFIAPKIIGGRLANSAVGGEGVAKIRDAISLKDLKITKFEKDILIEAGVN